MSNNQLVIILIGLFLLAFISFAVWVILRGPVERVQADGKPYPKAPDWRDSKDFIGPLEPCYFYNFESPAGSYTIAASKIRQQDIKWFGADFNTTDMQAWLNNSGYSHF